MLRMNLLLVEVTPPLRGVAKLSRGGLELRWGAVHDDRHCYHRCYHYLQQYCVKIAPVMQRDC